VQDGVIAGRLQREHARRGQPRLWRVESERGRHWELGKHARDRFSAVPAYRLGCRWRRHGCRRPCGDMLLLLLLLPHGLGGGDVCPSAPRCGRGSAGTGAGTRGRHYGGNRAGVRVRGGSGRGDDRPVLFVEHRLHAPRPPHARPDRREADPAPGGDRCGVVHPPRWMCRCCYCCGWARFALGGRCRCGGCHLCGGAGAGASTTVPPVEVDCAFGAECIEC
jgi:hypothetical protein